jgi:hypothetical protein
LEDVTKILSDIHTTYISIDAPRQIDVPLSMRKTVTAEIKQATQIVLPGMETIFAEAQVHAERLLASDIYARFVKHQITTSATAALGGDSKRYQGLGDCFCLTDPKYDPKPQIPSSSDY